MPTERDGAWLRRQRERLGMTQAQLAEAIGLSANFVSMMERGDRPVARRTVLAIHALRQP